MNPDWLGTYVDNGDTWEGGARSIRFEQVEGGVRFHYAFRSESNHGYSVAEQDGRVVSVDDSAITIEVMRGSASSWEDWFKEHMVDETTSSRTETIEIVRVENGKPVLRYASAMFGFARAN